MKPRVAGRLFARRVVRQAGLLAFVAVVSAGAVLLGQRQAEHRGRQDQRIVALASWDRDYQSISELLAEPDTVAIVGKVVAVGDAYPVGDGVPFTDSTVEVSEVLFGTSRGVGDHLVIRQTGGTTDKRTVELQDARLLRSGEDVLLFLRFDDLFAKYAIVGGPHGHYTIQGGTIRHANFMNSHPLAAFVEGQTTGRIKDVITEVGKAIDAGR